MEWRIEIVNTFVNQVNDKDCGVLVAFFFECISRKINFCNKQKGVSTDKYREWMAFCNYVTYSKNERGKKKNGSNREGSLKTENVTNDVIELE